MNFNTIPEALEDLRQGKIILVTDDPDRENEGDFICAAEFATTENINFMATHGKGLICMPMSEAFVRKLQFPQMVQNNTDNHETAFTVSIDHISTSTGISAAERSVTAMACVEEGARAEDFRRPGHMFPLLSKKNGVLEREGHTEATVDLCRLAGLKECGLCCEIMREDGTIMRTAELLALENPLPLPAYERILKAAHSFNLLDARKAISVTERQRYILRIRTLTKAVAEAYYASREALGFPMCNKDK